MEIRRQGNIEKGNKEAGGISVRETRRQEEFPEGRQGSGKYPEGRHGGRGNIQKGARWQEIYGRKTRRQGDLAQLFLFNINTCIIICCRTRKGLFFADYLHFSAPNESFTQRIKKTGALIEELLKMVFMLYFSGK